MRCLRWRRHDLRLRRSALGLLIGLALLLGLPGSARVAPTGTPTQPLASSSEALAERSAWSRPQSYPLQRRPRTDLYRPSADWIGRLILPSRAELADRQGPADDWVWIAIEQAPAGQQALIGRTLRLRWADRPELRHLVAAVSSDIHLGSRARLAAAQGNVVPERLDGRRVGPLQSLAGARPRDDVTVLLQGVQTDGDGLRISRPPVQITGRWQGLVSVLGPAAGAGATAVASPGTGLWRVRHFNRASGGFDGPEEVIRIPWLPLDRYGRRLFDPGGLAGSLLNRRGWLIQGAPARDGVFTVQAITSRALLEPTAQHRISGTRAGLAYLRRGNWSPALLQRGSLHSTAVLADGVAAPRWQPGDRALLMHLFGGIGGRQGEPVSGWTVTGHFAFGEAQVERDPFSGEPRLTIRYHQIYANNPNGIVAGSQDWSAYAGNLQRGWLGSRPFSDVLVPMGPEVLDAIGLQAEVLAARYRSGDGQGVALVTAATSCVQDSAQALWIAIQQLRRGEAFQRLSEAERQRLGQLGNALEHLLTPFGWVRSDWAHNGSLVLAQARGRFQASQNLQDVLMSWRSLLPRGAHDTVAAEMLRAGLPLQVLRTNQLPGGDARLEPVAPTRLLGQLPLLGDTLARLGDGLFPTPTAVSPVWPVLILVAYGALALNLGRRSGFLPRQWRWPARRPLLRRSLGYLLMPAFVEELLFRGVLLPQPLAGVSTATTVFWLLVSTGLFVLYHPLAGRLWYPPGRRLFDDRRFLLQCALLGLACGLATLLTGLLWWAVLIHWLAVLLWLEPLQGRRFLQPRPQPLALDEPVPGHPGQPQPPR